MAYKQSKTKLRSYKGFSIYKFTYISHGAGMKRVDYLAHNPRTDREFKGRTLTSIHKAIDNFLGKPMRKRSIF